MVECGHKYLVLTILQRSEKELLRILREVDINHKSPINGLTALHFAIEWPWALQHLLNENADINATDDFGRRLIHLAVATGHFESAIALLQADCAIMTSKTTPSLLQLALQFTNAEQRSVIIPAIVDALADRHNRLLKLGRAALPEDQLSALEILESKLERKAPDIMIALFGSGFSVPQALALDDRSVYDTGDMHGSIRLSPQYAEMLWSAGFHDIDSPNHTGLTPMMQSWYAANFEMVNWFMQKGVSGRSRHQDAPLYGLHLLPVRIAYPGAYFRHDSDLIDTDLALILNLQHDQTINHDGCVCICAPQGCTPASFLVKRVLRIYDKKLYALFPKWCEKTNPSAELLEHSAREYTRAWICRKMLLPHTCCVIGQKCEIMVQPQQPENSYEVLFIAKLFVEDYMRLYDRRRPGYGGPLENFPRLFIGEVESTSNGGFMTFPSISSMARL